MKRSFYFCLIMMLMSGMLAYSVKCQTIPDTSILHLTAPETFQAVFVTTKGEVTIEAYREWSPEGADRLYQLVTSGFYTNNCIFRVQTGYVVQFGISDNSEANFFWDKHPISDEPVRYSNVKGVISYARDGAKTRTSQLFINMKNNFKLDSINVNGIIGYTPVARIIKGLEIVESFNSKYGFEPANHQDSVMVQGNAYWEKKFPGMDYIREARIIIKN